MNIVGGIRNCNNMLLEKIPNVVRNDILICTLNFEKDIFTISCAGKFEVTGTKSLKGKKWFPFVQVFYTGISVTILE